jgi:hypothetical protein
MSWPWSFNSSITVMSFPLWLRRVRMIKSYHWYSTLRFERLQLWPKVLVDVMEGSCSSRRKKMTWRQVSNVQLGSTAGFVFSARSKRGRHHQFKPGFQIQPIAARTWHLWAAAICLRPRDGCGFELFVSFKSDRCGCNFISLGCPHPICIETGLNMSLISHPRVTWQVHQKSQEIFFTQRSSPARSSF